MQFEVHRRPGACSRGTIRRKAGLPIICGNPMRVNGYSSGAADGTCSTYCKAHFVQQQGYQSQSHECVVNRMLPGQTESLVLLKPLSKLAANFR